MACGGMPCDKGICVSPSGPNPYTHEALNSYVDTLDRILWEEGYIGNKDDLADVVFGTDVQWVDAVSFDCGGRDSLGCYDGAMIRVTVETCLGETALAHELIHVYLYRSGVAAGDGDHSLRIWDTKALEPLLLGFCGDKYSRTVFGPIGGI
jgi:hypothetical protein